MNENAKSAINSNSNKRPLIGDNCKCYYLNDTRIITKFTNEDFLIYERLQDMSLPNTAPVKKYIFQYHIMFASHRATIL